MARDPIRAPLYPPRKKSPLQVTGAEWDGGGGGGGFSPLSLSPFAWYDPSDLSSLFQLSNGTTAVTGDGDPVGYMADKSGNGNHLIQATANARPLYKTSDGLSWLEFDGSNDFLSDAFTLNQPMDRIMAFRGITYADGDTYWDGDPGTGNACRFYQSGVSPEVKTFAGSEIELDNDPAIDADSVITERWNGASSRFTFDNNAYQTANPGTNNPSGLVIGCFGDLTQAFANMRFYGGVVFSSAQSDASIELLRTYLAAKQGRVL